MWTQVSKCVKIQQVGKATGITQLSMNLDHLSDLAPNEYFSFGDFKGSFIVQYVFFFLILEIKYLGIYFFFVKYYD